MLSSMLSVQDDYDSSDDCNDATDEEPQLVEMEMCSSEDEDDQVCVIIINVIIITMYVIIIIMYVIKIM